GRAGGERAPASTRGRPRHAGRGAARRRAEPRGAAARQRGPEAAQPPGGGARGPPDRLANGPPAGVVLALTRFRGRTLAVSAVNTGMGLPPVVVGLFVTILLWRSGPLGALEILYTPAAIIVAQAVIAAPIVTGITLAAVQQVPREFRLQLLALGASRVQMVWVVLREARLPMLAAVLAGV